MFHGRLSETTSTKEERKWLKLHQKGKNINSKCLNYLRKKNSITIIFYRKELFSTRSSSNPCLRNSSSSMIPVSIRSHSSQHVSPSSIDSYETSSMIDYSQYEQKKEIVFVSPLPDIVHPHKNEHSETMQRYDRLLEKMRATDEQLHILSRSWVNNTQQKPSVSKNQLEGEILIKSQSNKNAFLSPMILQVCLIILVIFNLLAVCFFNEINLLWSQYVGNTVIAEQHDEGTSNF